MGFVDHKWSNFNAPGCRSLLQVSSLGRLACQNFRLRRRKGDLSAARDMNQDHTEQTEKTRANARHFLSLCDVVGDMERRRRTDSGGGRVAGGDDGGGRGRKGRGGGGERYGVGLPRARVRLENYQYKAGKAV